MQDSSNIKGRTIKLLLDAYRNETKVLIITLLLKNKSMTVTQLSKYIRTSRSNLYQTVKDMVKSGLLVPSESKIIKNYVEKYYKLNISLLDTISYEDLFSEVEKLDEESFRQLLVSSLKASSILLNIISEGIKIANENEIRRLKSDLKGYGILSMGTFSKEVMKNFNTLYRKFLDESELENKASKEPDEHILLVFSFPMSII